MLGDANTGFKNSKIAIQLYLHCIEKYPGPEGKPIFEEFVSFKVELFFWKQLYSMHYFEFRTMFLEVLTWPS